MHFRILVAALVLATTCSAQWLGYPTSGIPRTRDGKPNLTAATPRTREKKPDLSGLWMPENEPGIKGTNGEPLPKLFIDVGMGLKPGELMMSPWAKAIMDDRDKNFQADDPLTQCKPLGGPRMNYLPAPIKAVQTPGMLILMYEAEHNFRQIYIDGRKLPQDPLPSNFGYSTSRWEGETLVVETVGFHDQGWLDAVGHPHSEALHLTERFRRRDFGHMQVAITIDDPKAYLKPFTVTQELVFLPDSDLLEYFCAENERDVRHFVFK